MVWGAGGGGQLFFVSFLPWTSLVAQTVKNLPATQETQVGFLSQEEPLEKERATHSSMLLGESHEQSNPAGYSPHFSCS